MKILNNPRSRSILAGALGGLIGWLVAELLFADKLSDSAMTATLGIGAATGLGVGAVLGVVEGLAIQAWSQARRGLMIGLVGGALGGLVGATIGQLSYQAVAGESASGTEDNSGNSGSLFDPEMKRRLASAGARAGEIEIGLIWNNQNDLDLHVIEPGGNRIYFGARTSVSGGLLDVDRNAGCSGHLTREPVEHIVWTSNAPEGEFRIEVDHYKNCGQVDPTPFTVQLKLDGEVETFSGQISYLDPPVSVHRFNNNGAGSDTVPSSSSSSSGSLLPHVAQVLGWIFFGAMVGLSQGIVRRSSQAIKNAGMGGALGGAVGGIVFLLIAKSLGASSPGASRAVGFAILGAAIGLFMVLVEQALSAALVIVSGRFEGREVFLDRPVMRIGRGELLEIYIGSDAQMKTHHATIEKNASGHVISASEGALLVNGTAVNSQQLSNGDMIELGSTRLAYRWKAASPESTSLGHHDTGSIHDPPAPGPPAPGPIAEPTPAAGQEPPSGGAQPPPPPARKSRPAPEAPSSTSWKTEPQPPSPRIPDKPGEHRGPPPPPPPPSRKK